MVSQNDNKNTNFIIPKDGYLVFDSSDFKRFIRERLNTTAIFTDQNFEGSYLSSINEVLAYGFSTLLFYLNKTSTESQFSEAQLYENMNRIVKLFDYKPIGIQTSTLSFDFNVLGDSNGLLPGVYTIPRYSYIENGIASYSFNEDITFVKNQAASVNENMIAVAEQKLLYQGKFVEYPLYTAVGNNNEVIFFAPGDNVLVDHFNCQLYVYEDDGKWRQWKQVPSLYLENAYSRSFELRLNEYKRYEIKFGNDINGKKLNVGNKVSLYYLQSNGSTGEVGIGGINGRKLVIFSSNTYNQIITDLNEEIGLNVTYMTNTNSRFLQFLNTKVSTYYTTEETVDNVRDNAPGIFRSQYRLVTEADYQNYIKTNFANIVHDVTVANNWKYLSEQMKYYYDIGISNINNNSNLLYNQMKFADACNFNNVYLTVVPKTVVDTRNPMSNLTPSQKELIISTIQPVKTLTTEVVILDPVFIAVDVCIPANGTNSGTIEDANNTEILLVKEPTSRRDDNSLIADVYTIFSSYFSRNTMKLGSELDINYLVSSILNVSGIKTFYTRRKDKPSIVYNGLQLLVWNPVYMSDMQLTTKNIATSYFKYLFLNNRDSFINKIVVSNQSRTYESIEY